MANEMVGTQARAALLAGSVPRSRDEHSPMIGTHCLKTEQFPDGVEEGGFEPPSSADRLGLLRAYPAMRSRLEPPAGRRGSRPARLRCPATATRRNRHREPAHDARPRAAGDPGRTAA